MGNFVFEGPANPGGKGSSKASGVTMKRDKQKGESVHGIAVRFGDDVLKAMRWQPSDKVQFAVDASSNTAAFKRVPKDGYTLSASGGTKTVAGKRASSAARLRSHTLAARIPKCPSDSQPCDWVAEGDLLLVEIPTTWF